jgi:rhodanese-related sulfurtransferase
MDSVTSVSATDFAEKFQSGKLEVIDVRKPDEFASGHIETARNLPLDYINDLMAEFPKDKTLYIHCAGGYRSMIAASILKSRGVDDVINIEGGFGAVSKTNVPVLEGV